MAKNISQKHRKLFEPVSIDTRGYTGRDTLMVALINGATKGGAAVDRRREASRKACRRPYRDE